MTRQNKIKRNITVKTNLYFSIQRVGYFNEEVDSKWLFPVVASTCNCSTFFVKMMWKEIKQENPYFVSNYSY